MNKTAYLFVGILAFAAAFLGSFVGNSSHRLGAEGDSNLTNVVTSGYITDGGALTVTGASTLAATTVTGASTFTATTTHVGATVNTGATLVNNLNEAINGFSNTFTTTSTITVAQFCAGTTILVQNTTSTITLTLPAATSSFATCGSPTAGAYSKQLIVNNSTNTVVVAAGTGMTLMNQTTGPGTTTISGVINTIPATSTQLVFGIWLSSSSFQILQGSTYH